MKRRLGTMVLGFLLGLVPWLTAKAAPAHDRLSDALALNPTSGEWLQFDLDFAGATAEAGEPAVPQLPGYYQNGTVWMRWSSSHWADVEIQSYAVNSADTLVAVFAGGAPGELLNVGIGSLDAIQCDEVRCHRIGWVDFRARPETTYHIALIAPPDAPLPLAGPVALKFIATDVPSLVNDNFGQSTLLEGRSVAFQADNTGATRQSDETVATGESTLWWRWTAPADGYVQVRTRNATFDPAVNLFRGETLASLNPADQGGTNVTALPVGEGQQFFLSVGSAPAGAGGPAQTGRVDLQLTLTETDTPPTNDRLAQATELDLTHATELAGDLTLATQESGEANVKAGFGSVWYSATPAVDGFIQVAAVGEGFPAQVAAYRGADFVGLDLAGLEDTEAARPLVVRVNAGESLRLQVSVAAGWPGQFTLIARLLPARVNDAFANRIVLTGLHPTLSVWLAPGGVEPGEPQHAPTVSQSAWWTWEAPITGMAEISGDRLDNSLPNLEVYTGSAVDRLIPVPVNRNGGPQVARFNVDAGRLYQLALLGNPQFEGFVALPLSVAPTVLGSNDRPENAMILHGAEVGHSSNYTATRAPGEPAVNAQASRIIWWRWRSSVADTVEVFFPTGTLRQPTVAIYKGDSPDGLTLVTSGAGYAKWSAATALLYWLAVETVGDDVGEVFPQLVQRTRGIYGSRIVPGNLVQNGSFENRDDFLAHWSYELPIISGGIGEPGGADGGNYVDFSQAHRLWQDLPTEPGATYKIEVATKGYGETNRVRVTLGDHEAGTALSTPGVTNYPPYWSWDTFFAVASGNVTRLQFEQLGGADIIDGIAVTKYSAAPLVQHGLQDQVAFAGLGAAFTVTAIGSAPLHYRWSFEGQPLADAPDGPTLLLPAVTQAQAGLYGVTVSNAHGSVSGGLARLKVEDSSAPAIVAQPEGDMVVLGQYFALTVSAVGAPPLTFQWLRGGVSIPAATNRTLVLGEVTQGDFGDYTVLVSSPGGGALSLPAAVVETRLPTGGGTVIMRNTASGGSQGVNAPIYDVDGSTPLSGADFVAQLYAGPTDTELRPVGEPVPFRSAGLAGYFLGGSLNIPGVAPGAFGQFQVRVWESRTGPSYEAARASGGRFGRSATFRQQTAELLTVPSALVGLQSFALEAGVPSFFVGRVDAVGVDSDGKLRWHLTGQPKLRYVIEVRRDGSLWTPLTVLVSDTGSIDFTDSPDSNQIALYRARLLD